MTWSFISEISGETTMRDARQQQRGQLVAHGLARAGGHHTQHVVPAEQLIHQLLLPFAKALVAEHPLEHFQLVQRRRHPLFQNPAGAGKNSRLRPVL